MEIRCIARIRRMLRAWRSKATSSRGSPPDVPRGHVGSNCRKATSRSPPDVPPGHVAVLVGSNCSRYIVRATHLNHPIFRRLLDQIGEEYGFPNYSGPLWIPCDESQFEKILRRVDSDLKKCTRTRNDDLDRFGQSPLSLLCGFTT